PRSAASSRGRRRWRPRSFPRARPDGSALPRPWGCPDDERRRRGTMTPAVRAVDLAKSYGTGAAAVRVFEGVSMEVLPGEFVAVVGPSGCGKSTLLHLLAGIDSPDAGFVEMDGVAWSSLDADARAKLRNERVG